MKMLDSYKSVGLFSESAVLEYMLSTLKETIRTYDFFVAWSKVLGNTDKINISLNILNSLIGKNNLDEHLKELIKNYPEVVPVMPLLIAVRDTSIKVADLSGDIEYSFAKCKCYTNDEINKIVYFADKCGLLKILADKKISNLVDYAIGIEVGLDTNARKNRSGDTMEGLTEVYIKNICDKRGFRYLAQATADQIKSEFGKNINTDKSERKFDFAIDTPAKIYLIEVNYYGGGGSKLKAVAGEFKHLFDLVHNQTTGFIWVTDGKGWQTARLPLSENFTVTDFVINIKMIEGGMLEEIITRGL